MFNDPTDPEEAGTNAEGASGQVLSAGAPWNAHRFLADDGQAGRYSGLKSSSGQLWITRLYRGILNSEAQKRPLRHHRCGPSEPYTRAEQHVRCIVEADTVSRKADID